MIGIYYMPHHLLFDAHSLLFWQEFGHRWFYQHLLGRKKEMHVQAGYA